MATNNGEHPISSNSRTKLNAFRYQDKMGSPGKVTRKDEKKTTHGNKENQSSWLNGVAEPMQTAPEKAQLEPPAEALEEAKPAKECPQTPGNRIPLADLISNAEDAFDPAPGPEVTPVDHVIWQHVPVSSNPDTSSQTPAGGRRKRCRGSSSPSSPTNGNSKRAPKEPLDLQSIQALFKTPQHDLATELWNNYVDKNMVDGSEDLPPARLANLLSSSPRTPGSGRTSRDSSGLRRSISCAAEWPTSRAKRRRINRQGPGSGRGIFSRTSSNVLDSGKKSSRINVLLERIEKSLQPASTAAMGPPGSSPLRQQIDARRCRSSSPTTERKNLGEAEVAVEALGAATGNYKTTGRAALQDSSSDFGDDDLDQDFMDLANTTTDPFVEVSHARKEFDSFDSSGWSNIVLDKPLSNHPKQQSQADQKAPMMHKIMNNDIKPDDSDDFEDDFGAFDDEFEEMLAKCDQRPDKVDSLQNRAEEKSSKKPDSSVTSLKADTDVSGDEFDDDIDLDFIEQTLKQAGENGAYVCHS